LLFVNYVRNFVRKVGRQAPLGHHGDGPAELRTETSGNNGTRDQRAQVIGNVSVEEQNTMDVETEDSDLATEPLVEGRGDILQRQPAPIRRTNNGTRRRNVHIGWGGGFNAGSNDPSSRFQHIASGYASLE